MKNRTPHIEFSRPLQVDRVPKLGSTEKLAAEPAGAEGAGQAPEDSGPACTVAPSSVPRPGAAAA